MKLYIVLIFVLLYNSNVLSQESECRLNDDEEHTFLTENYVSKKHDICLELGYKLLVKVEKLETAIGDYLIISGNDDDKKIIFTQSIKEEKVFIIDQINIHFQFQVNRERTDCCTGAIVKYQRIGKYRPTTTQNPIQSSTWPQPAPQDSIYFTGYLYGQSYLYFDNWETRNSLIVAISKMAIKYTAANEFPLLQEITDKNVLLYKIGPCDLTWPDTEQCSAVTFSLPIIQEEDGYELKVNHLEMMWLRYAEIYLKEINFEVYQIPDINDTIFSWGLLIGIFLFIFLLAIGICVIVKDKTTKRRKMSDTMRIIDNNAYMKSTTDDTTYLGANRHQIFPPNFDVDEPASTTWVHSNIRDSSNA